MISMRKQWKKDWLALLKECKQMLIEDGIIQTENQMEEAQEEQSGGMEMG